MDVGNIRYLFAVGPVRMELPIEQILILVEMLSHLLPLPAAADFCKQAVFLHDTQDGLRITVNAAFFQHQPHPAVSHMYESCAISAPR